MLQYKQQKPQEVPLVLFWEVEQVLVELILHFLV